MSQRQFQIVTWGDGSPSIIFQLETEISEQPQEGREGVDELLRVVPILPVEDSCQLHDQTQTIDGLLVDAANTVVDELRAKEQSE